jgi:hypothetical protein
MIKMAGLLPASAAHQLGHDDRGQRDGTPSSRAAAGRPAKKSIQTDVSTKIAGKVRGHPASLVHTVILIIIHITVSTPYRFPWLMVWEGKPAAASSGLR